jgi:tRNA/tmRNA/rRNA uracil-C5-methylase (TrmA/RlmC/RlmD family)
VSGRDRGRERRFTRQRPAGERQPTPVQLPPIELTIERPVAGGRMLARHEGRVVLVAGAIPGEVVRARYERVERGVAFARVEAVLTPSPDRRAPSFDPACGGGVYAHVALERQVALKRDVILDGLRRGAGLAWDRPLAVAASPEHGYRLRARLHVRGGRVGFFKEATHVLCDAAPSAQLAAETLASAQRVVEALGALLGTASTDSLEVSEDLDGRQRAVHLHPIDRALLSTTMPAPLAARLLVDGVTGVSVATTGGGSATLAGDPTVADDLDRFVRVAPAGIRLRRHAASFFQGNRFLVPALTQAVVDAVPGDGPVWDLYAGVGLFAAALAASGRARVTAVEGDPISAGDLQANAAAFGGRLAVEARAVEAALAATALPAEAIVVVDPPRTGLAPAVTAALAESAVRRIVYVSCDVATLARDIKVFAAAGFAVESLAGFDLFPNTAHVETLAVLQR